ncbi:MAG: type II toxin-antitoxin system VapC family toxin [Betaproteobacteria bacterium]|nr:type II toxin-antitoxin system VapC family toxin [Betaproteobacteria bacterium]
MNCLLDTHAFLWAVFSPEKLSRKARAAITDPGNEICLSSISLWEISLKFGLGKLTLEHCSPESLVTVGREMGLTLISANADESASFHRLPRVPHRDPFDRMLAWLAIQRQLVLITKDAALPAYQAAGLKVLW